MKACDDCLFALAHYSYDDREIVEYECTHPNALEVWTIYDGEKCPMDLENDMSKVKLQEKAQLRKERERQ